MFDSQILLQMEGSSLESGSDHEYCTLSNKFELANKQIRCSKHKFDMQIDVSLSDGRRSVSVENLPDSWVNRMDG